jgi:hypothetical protein
MSEYNTKKEAVERLFDQEAKILAALINAPGGIGVVCKEVKINPDGHIIVRMYVEPKEAFLACKRELDDLFERTTADERHAAKVMAEPNVLAMVIGVIDLESLGTPDSKRDIFAVVERLQTDLQAMGKIQLSGIAAVEYNKRTFSDRSGVATTCFALPGARCDVEEGVRSKMV